jgi:hypothetical protein
MAPPPPCMPQLPAEPWLCVWKCHQHASGTMVPGCHLAAAVAPYTAFTQATVSHKITDNACRYLRKQDF